MTKELSVHTSVIIAPLCILVLAVASVATSTAQTRQKAKEDKEHKDTLQSKLEEHAKVDEPKKKTSLSPSGRFKPRHVSEDVQGC